MSRLFTDEPMIRTETPDGAHNGMRRVLLNYGWCNFNETQDENLIGFKTWHFGDRPTPGPGNIQDDSRLLWELDETLISITRENEKCYNLKLGFWLQEPINTDLTINVHGIIVEFDHTEATWTFASDGVPWDSGGMTSGIDYDSTPLMQTTIGEIQQSPYVEIDLSAWIRGICEGTINHTGLVIFGTDGSGEYQDLNGAFENGFAVPQVIFESAFSVDAIIVNDVNIFESTPDANGAANDDLYLVYNPGSSNNVWALFEIDASDLPPYTEIPEAYLYLEQLGGSNRDIDFEVHKLLVPWDFSEVTWNEASDGVSWSSPGLASGIDYDSEVLQSGNLLDFDDGAYHKIPCANLLQLTAGGAAPYGFVMIATDTGGGVQNWYSTRYVDPDRYGFSENIWQE